MIVIEIELSSEEVAVIGEFTDYDDCIGNGYRLELSDAVALDVITNE